MWAYWTMFLLPAVISVFKINAEVILRRRKVSYGFAGCLFLLFIFVAFRDETGGDWFNYVTILNESMGDSFLEAILRIDPGYGVISWVSNQVAGGFNLVNIICSIIFFIGLLKFCKICAYPWLALVISIPYLVIVVSMGYTRQSVAIGFAMIAISQLHYSSGSIQKYIFYLILGCLFHKSAIVLFFYPIVIYARNSSFKLILLSIFFIATYVYILEEQLLKLYTNYIVTDYTSSGAYIRILMSSMACLFYILYRKKFIAHQNSLETSFWGYFSMIGVSLGLVLLISDSTTAIDRVGLYWILAQIYILSRLPSLFKKLNLCLYLIIIALYLTVFVVWIFMADNAYAWLPYKFILPELM